MLGKLWYDGYKANHKESNPTKWEWKNATYVAGYFSNENAFYGGVGWNPNYTPLIGYRNGSFAMGYSQNGNTNMYHPGYNYNAPEQAAAKAIDQVRQEYYDIISMAGALPSAYAGSLYTEYLWGGGYWVGKNGKTYNMSLITDKGKGWNFYQNSANTAKNATKWARGIGNGLGILTTGYSGWQFWNNPTFSNGFSFTEGIGGLAYWPFGLADSYIHFGLDVVTPDVRRHQFEMLDRIDNGTFSPWDYRNIYPNYYSPYF